MYGCMDALLSLSSRIQYIGSSEQSTMVNKLMLLSWIFSKAFDSLSHAHLIRKLDQSGIKGPLLHWFMSYLGNRLQRVVIDGKS